MHKGLVAFGGHLMLSKCFSCCTTPIHPHHPPTPPTSTPDEALSIVIWVIVNFLKTTGIPASCRGLDGNRRESARHMKAKWEESKFTKKNDENIKKNISCISSDISRQLPIAFIFSTFFLSSALLFLTLLFCCSIICNVNV